MDELDELIKSCGLEESHEYVIIPFLSSDGRKKRCFLLKRRYMRIMPEDGHYVDCALIEAIKAIMRYPDLRVSEALYLLHKEEVEKAGVLGGDEMNPDKDAAKTITE
jgi:hypothetical protein